MKIRPYTADMAPELTAFYNRQIRTVPHCYAVREETLAATLAGSAPEDRRRRERLYADTICVATEGASIAGFVHAAGLLSKTGQKTDSGIIRFLGYEPGKRVVGQALLQAAEETLTGHGIQRISAFPQDHTHSFYYLSPAYLSDRLGHVQALLGFNGYEKDSGEVFLDWPNYAPLEPELVDIPAKITLEWKQGKAALPGLTVLAHQNGEEIGTCGCISLGEVSQQEIEQDWLFVKWLGVEDRLQGKGLGRYLLQRAQKEMYEVGYRHAGISTAWKNYRAFTFYSNYGYHVVDWTYGFQRQFQ